MTNFLRDLKQAFRSLWRAPLTSFVAITSLAAGIGANSAVFSAINTILLHPLPYGNSDRLVMIVSTTRSMGMSDVSYPDYLEWKDQARSLEGVAATRRTSLNLTGSGEPKRLAVATVTSNYFATLGVRPLLGRDFAADDDAPGAAPVLMLSHALWQHQFGGDSSVLGRRVLLDGVDFSIVGVMPPDQSALLLDAWVPIRSSRESLTSRGQRAFRALACLKRGVSIAQARTEIAEVARRMETAYPATNAGFGINVIPLAELTVGPVRPALQLIAVASGLILLVACSNVSCLLLSRCTARLSEMSVRAALGATRAHIVRLLAAEYLWLSLFSAVLGLLLARLAIPWIIALTPDSIPRREEIQINAGAVGYALLIALLCTAVFGLLPAIRLFGADVQTLLRQATGATAGRKQSLVHSVVAACQFALTLALVISAGLLLKSFVRLRAIHPGFESAGILTMQLSLPAVRYSANNEMNQFYKAVLENASQLPGVEAAAAIDNLPLTSWFSFRAFYPEGWPVRSPADAPRADVRAITPDFFRAMRIALRAGRSFSDRDTSASPPVAIVSESLARAYWRNDAVGQQFKLGAARLTVAGVVDDIRQTALDASPRMQIYLPLEQSPRSSMILVVRNSSPVEGAAAAIARNAVQTVDKEQPVFNVRSMDQVVSESLGARRLILALVGAFAVLAIFLAVVGVYGAMSDSVQQRTREIGVRMALGATSWGVLGMILSRGMKIAVASAGAGILLAFSLDSFLIRYVYGVSVSDIAVFVTVTGGLLIVAFVANLIPSWRASRINPTRALRHY